MASLLMGARTSGRKVAPRESQRGLARPHSWVTEKWREVAGMDEGSSFSSPAVDLTKPKPSEPCKPPCPRLSCCKHKSH